jgi:hypothetical protein
MSTTAVPQVIRFNLPAAQDALARLDEGVAQPGDELMALQYDAYCQQEWERHYEAQQEAERAAWLETQCPDCMGGGTGERCDKHAAEHADEESE